MFGAGVLLEISIPSALFCCQSQTAVKKEKWGGEGEEGGREEGGESTHTRKQALIFKNQTH